ncbi:MAG TPA: gliding motility-associated ABC transporter substrate-binding protein GldG [Paludibacter sp.]|nr:gliding motility-associated ABC transporter substrate-binding protein GldG [Paludibacter sp.]
MRKSKLKHFLLLFSTLSVLAFFTFYTFRIDLTEDNRYSISPYTVQLMKNLNQPVHITLYLNGDLNPAFHRLRKATTDIIDDLSKHTRFAVSTTYVNPSRAGTEEERLQIFSDLAERGLTPTEVYMRDKEGKSTRKIIFPWIEIETDTRKIAVPLLKNLRNKSGEENINISIENLEFEIADALRKLNLKTVRKIAFLEGHGEFSEAETYEITKSLSRYYQIDRGALNKDASVLNDYPLIIVAGPQTAFSEEDKYILDQYIMYGGSILWLVDGVKYDKQQLTEKGFKPVIEADLNLQDIFFRYGVKINPVVIQDLQCVNTPVNVAPKGEQAQFDWIPWHYAPLLLSSDIHPISKNTGGILSEFVSGISIIGKLENMETEVLLVSSHQSKVTAAPAIASFHTVQDTDPNTFHSSYLPVAVMVSGNFQSNFNNRIPPTDVITERPFKSVGNHTRQLFIAGSSIIRNETTGIASDSTCLPLGYDRTTGFTYGNELFLINAVHYLTNQEELIELRAKSIKIRLLNQGISLQNRTKLQIINIALPFVCLLLFAFIFNHFRKKKYTQKVK